MSWLGRLLARVAVILAEPIAQAVAERIARSSPPDPNRPRPPFGRAHQWNPWEPGATLPLRKRPRPICDYCQQEQTDGNVNASCPGPPPMAS